MRWIVGLSTLMALGGCYLDHGLDPEPPITRPEPPPEPPTTEPRTTEPPPSTPEPEPVPDVLASISSVMLGDDCDAGADSGIGGDCDGECFACQQSSMQLLFEARLLTGPLQVEILRVRLLDADTGAPLDELAARDPKHWGEEGYDVWDERIVRPGDERTSYDLSAPNWERIGGGDIWSTYSRLYRLEITLLIGDQEVTLLSEAVNRPSDIDT